ncbi:MAG: hypothetical protein K2O40_04455 [Lachnospiraceae bacterium]|nr:hypothetical protein [Lachnospiraceae bacterium]MDE7183730.1 hypothetical protein [Lachnospiraceae bacterium]
MNKKSWLTGLLIIILSCIAVLVRMYYVNTLMTEVNISEDIYNAAKVSIDTNGLKTAFADGIRIESFYICNLYLAFLIFGNFTVAGVYLNILYQVLTIILVYILLRNLTNRFIGFAGSLILAIFPIYIESLSEVTMFHMQLLIAAFVCTVVDLIVCLIFRRHAVKIDSNTEQTPNPLLPDVAAEKNQPDESMSILPDTSMKEIRYDDLEDNKVQYIENPLPVPKRREHKEMDYAFEPTGKDDDYDVSDMTGKDYFDIE